MAGALILGPAAQWLLDKVFDQALSEALARLMRHRREVAREILLRKLARAEINISDAEDQDEAAAMVFDYVEAARQGAARRNLLMLAGILAGRLAAPPIYASEFLRWSRILADLTTAEIITLGKLHSIYNNQRWATADGNKDYNGLTEHLKEVLIGDGIARNALDVYSILGALQRTGLVVYSAGSFGGSWHLPTPSLDDLLKLIDIEEVLAEPNR